MRATPPRTMVCGGGSCSSSSAAAGRAAPALLLLLVAALLVLGTCASGARANSSNVDLVNTCANDTLVLLYNSTVSGIVIPAGGAVGVDLAQLPAGPRGPLVYQEERRADLRAHPRGA